MRANLLISPFYHPQESRRCEFEHCIQMNLKAGFDRIIALVEIQDLKYAQELFASEYRAVVYLINERPNFEIFLHYANLESHENTLNCISNLDVFITKEHLQKLKDLPWDKKKLFVALSRWDIKSHDVNYNILNQEHFNRADSQDFWCYEGETQVHVGDIKMGVPGCDNVIANKFEQAGYIVKNPSLEIITHHLHRVALSNYYNSAGEVTFRYNPPYTLIAPHKISEV